MSDPVARIQKLFALAGNNPSQEEAEAAWTKAQAMIGQLHKLGRDPSDTELRRWFLDNAAPCRWVIMVTAKLDGSEYAAVVDAGMLACRRNTERMPTWRLVEVPLAFRGSDYSDILHACYDGRIAWRAA